MNIFSNKKLFCIEDGILETLRVSFAPWYKFWAQPTITTTHIRADLRHLLHAQAAKIAKIFHDKEKTKQIEQQQALEQIFNQTIDATINQVIIGTKTLPSNIKAEGDKLVGIITRKLIEEIQTICHDEFHEIVGTNLAQMLIFARKEVAGSLALMDFPLPLGTRFVSRWGNQTTYVIEEPPRVRTIIWDDRQYRLSFPYCVFLVRYEETKYVKTFFFFRNAPITNGNDSLFFPPLPDISEVGTICFPTNLIYPEKGPAELTNYLQTTFWNSNFRSEHLGHHIGKPINRNQWIRLTTDNPHRIIELRWTPTRFKVNHQYDDVMNPTESMTELKSHNTALARRVSAAIGEKIIGKIDTKISQTVFSDSLATAIKKTNITAQIVSLLKSKMGELPNSLLLPKTTNVADSIAQNLIENLIENMEKIYDQRN